MKKPQPHSIESYVAYSLKAYEEAYAECDDLELHARKDVAQMAWRCCLPILDSSQAARAFIACVAAGQARQYLTPDESRALMYTAQLSLAALKGGGK